MKKLIVMIMLVSFVSACATDPYTGESKVSKTAWGTGIGAVAGAGIGALVGGKKGAAWGAGIGAAAGAGTGGYMDLQARKLRQELLNTGVQVSTENGQIRLIMPSNITFDTDSAVFKPNFNPVLDSVAKVFAEYDKTMVQITGHTDSTGTVAYNNTLSQKRASAVATYLINRGIAPSRISAAGMGPSRPIATNDTAAGREQNRRVEISIIQMQ